MKKLVLLLVSLLLVNVPMVLAQGPTEHLEITSPLVVSELSGVIDVVGSADMPGMAYYYIEIVGLNDDLSVPENAPWLPMSAGLNTPVTNGVLARIDTRDIDDGLYALRLTVNTAATDTMLAQTFHYAVSPLRVSNAHAHETEVANQLPELPDDSVARVTSSTPHVSPNVRYCDIVDNDRCPIVEHLDSEEAARVVGISSRGTGWFKIEVQSGVEGWISPTVVTPTGDFAGVPKLAPPSPLAPRPVQAPEQPSAVYPNGMAIVGGAASCGQAFNVQVNLGNTTNATAPNGQVLLQDIHVASGTVNATGYGSYAAIGPQGNFVVSIPLVVTTYVNEEHELRATNNGHSFSVRYTLGQGQGCAQATVPPTAQPPSAVYSRDFMAGQCSVTLNQSVTAYQDPGGAFALTVYGDTYPAQRARFQGNNAWYQISLPDDSMAPVWVIPAGNGGTAGDCAIR